MATRLEQAENKPNVSNESIAQFAIEAGQAQREIDEATGRKRAILKRAKSAGVDTKVLLAALALKRRDPDEVVAEQRNIIRYAGIIAPHLAFTQTDLFGGLDLTPLAEGASRDLQEWDADEQGYNAGLNGGSLDDCPAAPGTPVYVRFQEGYHRGQAAIAARMGENAEQARPGRRKKKSGRDAAAGEDRDDRQVDLEQAL